MRRKGATQRVIAWRMIRRGAEIFALGLVFRVQEFLLGWTVAPWTDLLRVDILNLIGLSVALLGVLCWVVRGRTASALASAGVALGIALVTPMIWTTWRPHWLPWYLDPISTACTFTIPPSRGCSRFFRGPHLLLPAWRPASSFSASRPRKIPDERCFFSVQAARR